MHHLVAQSLTKRACARAFTTSLPDFSQYFCVTASNAAREDATKLVVKGPDLDGIMASMTVALATKGCSLVELHAAKATDAASHQIADDEELIEDTFYVVRSTTGEKFKDSSLEDLAKSLLASLERPMSVLGATGDLEAAAKKLEHHTRPTQRIKVVKSFQLEQ